MWSAPQFEELTMARLRIEASKRHIPKRAPRAAALLKVVYKDLSDMKSRKVNPRTHTPKQIKQIAASIQEFGFINPVLTDAADRIIAGHARTEAAKLLGMTDVPTVRVDHLTPAQIRAYVIADNKLAENAGWDRSLLALEFQELSVELNFDLTITGLETAEVDLVVSELRDGQPDEADGVPAIDRAVPAVSRPGDLWRIGNHVLLCGDALKSASYERLLGRRKAQLVFTDPPYNVAIARNASGLGKAKHPEFTMASGEMSADEFAQFLKNALGCLAQFSADGSIHYIFMDWRHSEVLQRIAASIYSEFKNLCVWTKTNAGMGSLYRSQHEMVFVFKNGKAPHINNVELGRFGRNRTNVWSYAGVNSFGKERENELAMHPTVKPVALVADAILDCSRRGGIVLDAFAGSGSTLIAAERTGRQGYGIEIDPYYVDTIIRRFVDVYGLNAVHAETKLEFAKMEALRSQEKRCDR
jgi:DNA modification methylase